MTGLAKHFNDFSKTLQGVIDESRHVSKQSRESGLIYLRNASNLTVDSNYFSEGSLNKDLIKTVLGVNTTAEDVSEIESELVNNSAVDSIEYHRVIPGDIYIRNIYQNEDPYISVVSAVNQDGSLDVIQYNRSLAVYKAEVVRLSVGEVRSSTFYRAKLDKS